VGASGRFLSVPGFRYPHPEGQACGIRRNRCGKRWHDPVL